MMVFVLCLCVCGEGGGEGRRREGREEEVRGKGKINSRFERTVGGNNLFRDPGLRHEIGFASGVYRLVSARFLTAV